MKRQFASGEVQAAMKQLQNNKSFGRENIKAEQLKLEQKTSQKKLQQFITKFQKLESTQMKSIKR